MPTETLRAMLDERGVRWHNRDSESDPDDCLVFKTWWKGNFFYEELYPNGDSYTLLEARAVEHITPEQAVEATLGRGTCHDKGNIERFICSECGCRLDLQDDDWEATMWLDGAAMVPNFCPNCGRRVEVDA